MANIRPNCTSILAIAIISWMKLAQVSIIMRRHCFFNPMIQEIKNNLSFAQNMRLDAIEEMPKTAMSRLHDSVVLVLSPDQWGYLAVSMIFLFVLGFIIYYILYSATYKRIAFIAANAALFMAVFSVAMGYLGDRNQNSKHPAIIFEREVVVTSEPNERSEKVFALHEGTKVNVLEALENWSKITNRRWSNRLDAL